VGTPSIPELLASTPALQKSISIIGITDCIQMTYINTEGHLKSIKKRTSISKTYASVDFEGNKRKPSKLNLLSRFRWKWKRRSLNKLKERTQKEFMRAAQAPPSLRAD
jgi:hypothetical protein